MAEELEKAAASGNLEFVKNRNGVLVAALEKLLPALENFLGEIKSADQKPLRPAPDPSLLAAVLQACSDYDIERLDKVMAALEQYRYEFQADLIEWLRKEIDISGLENIRERLESLNNENRGEEIDG
jgi:hypothetical protein